MNNTEHLLTCLAEEASEIIKDVSKSLRFGLDDVNVLDPDGPSNRQRIVNELNDFIALVEMCVEYRILPKHWPSASCRAAKTRKVLQFMDYAREQGTLT